MSSSEAPANDSNPAARYLRLLKEGKTEELLGIFAGEPEIHDPLRGHISGREAAWRFAGDHHSWLEAHEARAEHLRTTRKAGRAVAESVLRLVLGEVRVGLPVAIVGENGDEGRLQEVRVYHSTWPLTGGHRVRPPLLDAKPGLFVPDVVGDYQRALASGDLEGILKTFEPDGYAREPSGGEYVYQGKEHLRELYRALFSNGGGIPLEHCSVTNDGICCAIEYNVRRWGRTPLPPQAGIAVYERGRSGLLAAARIYDDVDPPLPG